MVERDMTASTVTSATPFLFPLCPEGLADFFKSFMMWLRLDFGEKPSDWAILKCFTM